MSASDFPKKDAIAIIGIGCLFPKASDLDSYWSNCKRGVDCITEVPPTHWRPEDYFDSDAKVPDHTYSRHGGFLDAVDFDPLEFGVAPNAIEATDTTQLLGMVAARAALEDAGYGKDRDVDREKVSVVLGVTGTLPLVIPLGARLGHPIWRRALAEAGVEAEIAEDVVRRIGEGYVPWQEASFPGLLGNVAAGRIANRLDLHGTNCVVDAACASSLSAIHLASLELGAGHCDLAVSGGLDTFNDIFMYMCFSKTPALSPSGHARPFDREADGTSLGEGLGVVVLKRVADAERDGDRIYAVIRGIGSSSDGRGQAIYAPSAEGQSRALERAYANAGVSPRSVELVEGHGTGTRVGDAIELSALDRVYRAAGEGEPWCAVGSVKSQIGHTKAAAGAASLIKAALALHDKVLPPTLKVEAPNDVLPQGESPLYVNSELRPWVAREGLPRRAAVSSFGFGGSNFHCILEEYGGERNEVHWSDAGLLLAFSAPSRRELAEALRTWPRGLVGRELRRRSGLARRAFRRDHPCRLLLAPTSPDALDALLEEAATWLDRGNDLFWSSPGGAFYGEGSAQGDLALLFPGQGAQYPAMLRDLACTFPELLQSLQEADRIFEGEGRLSDRIYPRPVFTDEERAEHVHALQATDVAQPALGAVSLGAQRLLAERFGLRARHFAGHSYGELVALTAAGRMTGEELHRFSGIRGRTMAAAGGDDAGTMLAVHGEIPEEILQGDLVLANRNTPRQNVLSGPTEAIDEAQERLAEAGIRSTRLQVAAAFHSPLVARAEAPWREALQAIAFPAGEGSVVANSSARPYPEDADGARDLLGGQLARSVDFVGLVRHLYEEAGCRTFVEIGPGRRLTGMVGEILGDQEHFAVALDASSGKRDGWVDLARLLGQVAALGHEVDLAAWDPAAADFQAPAEGGFRVQICGANPYEPPSPRPPIEGRVQASTAATPAPSRPTAPLPASSPPPAELGEALRSTQEGIAALQAMQTQTAELHRRFLEGQEIAQQSLRRLLEQQAGQPGLEGTPTASWQTPMPTPMPVARPQSPSAPPASSQTAPATPSPTPAATRVAAAPAAPAPKPDSATAGILLEVVAAKTGYPADMLDLDMGLDADLGIDSIKRVEILSALREQLPGTPELAADRLASLHTLREIAKALAGTSEPATPSPRPQPSFDAAAVLLEVVAAKTGYPPDMLDLDMGLDADLGIDSIKRVEILSALREQLPGAPELAADRLASLHTLREIAEALRVDATATEAPEPAVSDDEIDRILLQVVAAKTGYPADMLDLDMGLDADLGIDSIKRVEILSALREELPFAPELAADRLASLHTLREIADALQGDGPSSEAAGAPAPVAAPPTATGVDDQAELEPRSTGGVRRQVLRFEEVPKAGRRPRWTFEPGDRALVAGPAVPGEALVEALRGQGILARRIELGEEPAEDELAALVLLAPEGPLDREFPLRAFRTLRGAAQALRSSPRARLVSVSRLDGRFGLGDLAGDGEIFSAALAGLLKTAAHEWPEVRCTALDLAPGLPDTAALVLGELLAEGPLEIGISASAKETPVLEDATLPAREESLLSREDVVLVTGGARGVTAEVAVGLAHAGQPTIVVIGRTEAPGPEPEWLQGLETEAEIKDALFHRLEEPTPRDVEEAYRRLRAKEEIRQNLERLRATGATVSYRSVDIRDRDTLRSMIDDVERSAGKVTALVHGAGVLADRRIEDKSDEDFQRVLGTKVDGLLHLLELLEDHPLRCLVLFSSSTARFGRKGQADYAAANELLNKIAQRELRKRDRCHVVSVNWGPWDGGMVTPELKRLFASEGVEVIDLAAGMRYLVAELATPGPVEVVVLGGGTEPSAVVEKAASALPVAFERAIDLESHGFLRSHVLGGRPVFPVAMMVEWLAHAALHGNPGLRFLGFDELRVFQALALEGSPSLTVQVRAGRPENRDGSVEVPVELTSGSADSPRLHARGKILLGWEQEAAEPKLTLGDLASLPAGEAFYPPLFHGEHFQGLEEVRGWSEEGIEGRSVAARSPGGFVSSPLRNHWIADPLILDGAFQLMILWSLAARSMPCLPMAVGSYRQFRRFPKGGALITVRIAEEGEHRATSEIEFVDAEGRLLARMEGCENVLDASLEEAFRENQLEAGLLLPS